MKGPQTHDVLSGGSQGRGSLIRGAMLAVVFLAAMPGTSSVADFWRAEDLWNLERAADPRLSPDGSQVVFVRWRAELATDRWLTDLWAVDVKTGESRRLTEGGHGDHAPRWSPDGRRLAFLSERSGTVQIWLLDLATGILTQRTDLPSAPWGVAWSPDGEHLAFFARQAASPPQPFHLPEPPPGATWAKAAVLLDRLDYHVDGVGFLEPGWNRVWTVTTQGTALPQPLTWGAYHDTSTDWIHGERDDGAPVWSLDGRQVLISANRRPDGHLKPLGTEIYAVARANGAIRALTDRNGPDASPAVSPDGEHIAYLGFDDRRRGHQNARLYIMRRDGSDRRCLSCGFDRDLRSPRWTPDGRGVLVIYHDRGVRKVARVGLADGAVREVAADLGDGWSTYGAGSFTVARDGTVTFSLSRPEIPADVAVTSLESGVAGVRRLTDLNASLLASRRSAKLEEIRVRSTADGREIQGWALVPPGWADAPERRPLPLILDIHGGPYRDYGPRFDLEKQAWAARGFMVLYVNPRGSVGYGESFSDAIHHAFPGDDRHDLESAVAEMVRRGWADPSRLFVTGGSGGGLLSLWLISHRDGEHRYRAAASLYPVVSWESEALLSDISSRMIGYWLPGPPWEYPEHYRVRSPLSRVGHVETPVLLIAGEEDRRTPISQAELYFAALQHRGIESVLMRLPGEPHFDERRPSHQLARMMAVVGWFERWDVEGATATRSR